MNKKEQQNLINSLGQSERKSIWGYTRGIALIFNTFAAGFDRGIGFIASLTRRSEQRKVFKVRRQTIRKAKRDRAVAEAKFVIDSNVAKVKASVSGAVNSVKNSVSEKTSAVRKDIVDRVEANKAKAEEEKARRLAEKLSRQKAEEERLFAEQALKDEENRLAEEKRQEELRLAEEQRQEALRLAEEQRAKRAAMIIEAARQEEIRRAEEAAHQEKIKKAEEAAHQEAIRDAKAAAFQAVAARLEAINNEEVARQEEERLAEEKRQEELRLAEEKRQEELRLKEAKQAELEKRRCENAALFKAEEEFNNAKRVELSLAFKEKRELIKNKIANTKESFKQRVESERLKKQLISVAKSEANKAYIEQVAFEKEQVEKEKLEAQRKEAERLKAEADRLKAERLAKEEAERIRIENLEAERRAIALQKEIEGERVRSERVAREEAERIKAEEQRFIQHAINTANSRAEEAYLNEKKQEDAIIALALTTAKQKAYQEKIEKAKLEEYTRRCAVIAISKAEEQRRIATIQNRKLNSLYRQDSFKQGILNKCSDFKNSITTTVAEVKEHVHKTKASMQQRSIEARAIAKTKAFEAKAKRLALNLADRARVEQLTLEKDTIAKEQHLKALVAEESIRIERERAAEAERLKRERAAEAERLERERAAEAARIAREQKEAERGRILAEEAARKNAIDIALKLADDERNSAVEFERQIYTQLKNDEKQQKALERQVDVELKKLRKEADRFAAEEKKKEEKTIRQQEKDQAKFERRKRNLRRSKRFEKSTARLQKSTGTVMHKWSAYILHFVVCVAISAITCFFAIWLQPESTLHQSGLWLMNFWPILVTGFAFAFAFQNAFISGAINLVIWSLLSMANTAKMVLRDEPLYPSDLGLIKEAIAALDQYDVQIPSDDVGILIGATAALLLCGIVYAVENRGRIGVIKAVAGKTKCLIVRLGGFIVMAAIFVALMTGIYVKNEVYRQFEYTDYDHVSATYNSLGFPFSFCHYTKTFRPDMPDGYSKEEAMLYGRNIKTNEADAKIHVIMIMDEAYSDLTDLQIFNYKDKDPQFMFKELAQSEHGISGHIVVPGFAGGTAHTEFDVVTGMQTNMLSDTNIMAFRAFTSKQDSLLSIAKQGGYTTRFAHAGNRWYYNRENAYALLGADSMLFIEDMENLKYKGFMVADDYFADLIEDDFNNAVKNNEWLFSSYVTIQNHMTYTRNKYAGWDPEDVDVFGIISKEMQDAIGVYTMGIRDANYMLYRLKNFFEATDEPVMLVFYGDHMPYLGDGRQGYKEFGIDYVYSENDEEVLKMYETPYLIWCNDAGAKAINFEDAVKDLNLPEDGTIQASYLGSVVLDMIGFGDTNAWYSYLSEARQELPVTKFVDPSNEIYDRLKKWTYYKITQ